MFPVPFALYADFESFITPSEEHVLSGFCCLRVSQFPQYDHKIHTYSGDNVVQEFLKYVTGEQTEIDSILLSDHSINPLTDRERLAHNAATICSTCENKFTENSYKVHHRCHVTGKYIAPVCNNCNLQLKNRKFGNKSFIPLFMHNARSYDSHFIIKNLHDPSKCKSPSHTHKFGKISSRSNRQHPFS